MIDIQKTSIKGVYIIRSVILSDERGDFVKTFENSIFDKKVENWKHRDVKFTEHYTTFSIPNVLRGMHFQTYPFSLKKLVNVISGSIKDVVLDVRKDSSTYGKFLEIGLYPGKSLFIEEGIAHGFITFEKSVVSYSCTEQYDKKYDTGIHWNSFGAKWGDLIHGQPIVSERDKSFKQFGEERYDF